MRVRVPPDLLKGMIMTDDVVKRLRRGIYLCACPNGECEACTTDKDAADEIERLLEQVERQREQIEFQSSTIRHLTLKMERMFKELDNG